MPPRRRGGLSSVGSTAPKPQTPPPAPDLRVAVAESIKAMSWLGASDKAIEALALRLAEQIEETGERAEELQDLIGELAAAGEMDLLKRVRLLEAKCDVVKIVGWLGPQLQGVLKELGGTPAARNAMKQDKPIGGRLAALRDAAEKHER